MWKCAQCGAANSHSGTCKCGAPEPDAASQQHGGAWSPLMSLVGVLLMVIGPLTSCLCYLNYAGGIDGLFKRRGDNAAENTFFLLGLSAVVIGFVAFLWSLPTRK